MNIMEWLKRPKTVYTNQPAFSPVTSNLLHGPNYNASVPTQRPQLPPLAYSWLPSNSGTIVSPMPNGNVAVPIPGFISRLIKIPRNGPTF